MHNTVVFALVIIVDQNDFIVVMTFFNYHHFICFMGMTAAGDY